MGGVSVYTYDITLFDDDATATLDESMTPEQIAAVLWLLLGAEKCAQIAFSLSGMVQRNRVKGNRQ